MTMSTAMIKVMLLGLFALMFATAQVYAKKAAADDEREEETPRKQKRGSKSKRRVDLLRPFVAIQKFENKSGVSAPELETIHDRLQACMAGSRKFEIIEREQLNAAMREQSLAAAGGTDGDAPDASVVRGPSLKTGFMFICGSVLSCHVDRTGVSTEGAFMTWTRYSVELDVKVGDVSTGRIIRQKCVAGTSIEVGSRANSQPGQGLRDAVDEACRLAVDALRDATSPARVVKVGKKDITITLTEAEVKVGDVFDLIETDSQRSLGGEKVGRVRITDTDPEASRARPVRDAEGRIVALDEIDLEESFYIVRRVSRAKLMSKERK